MVFGLQLTILKSFSSHPKAEFWDYERNDSLPRDVFKNSHKKYFFNCGDCEHTFCIRLNDVSQRERWCPYCANQKLCSNNTCVQCFHKSFASDPKAKFWDYEKNGKYPRDVFKNTHKKHHFNCGNCGHTFDKQLNKVSKGSWCFYCSHTKLCLDSTCEMCFKNSFASHPKAEFWDYEKNEKSPRQVFKNAHKKYYFNCDCGNGFVTNLLNVSQNGNWCPKCATHKRHSQISITWLDFLQGFYNIKILHAVNDKEHQIKIDNKQYFVDGYCKEQNTVFEFNGDFWHGNPEMYDQNHINVRSLKTFGELYKNTLKKKQDFHNAGYKYVDIWERDWRNAIKLVKSIQRKWRQNKNE
tara:strand:- start:906 stop:1964 length:1059 start_codon:yes stop_codon:yes gene_type:complete